MSHSENYEGLQKKEIIRGCPLPERQPLMPNAKLLIVFALLICNAARGLASRLARGLALAASAVLNGLCNIFGFDSLNSVHWFILR